MIVRREEPWGELSYKTPEHTFECSLSEPADATPYPSQPVVLNIDLTFRCNMHCIHCVAMDLSKRLGGIDKADLQVSSELITRINESPFLAIVITGGEPLLGEYREKLRRLINGLRNKGIIIDTNGTIYPDKKTLDLLRKKDVMVRISWDVPHPSVECELRVYDSEMFKSPVAYMASKEDLLKSLVGEKLPLAIQTVLHKKNYNNSNLFKFPKKLSQLGIRKWHIQRFIPSHLVRNSGKYLLDSKEYEWAVQKISQLARRENVECITKLDRRHNSVFLLVKDGDLFTQSDEKPGQKIRLGKIGEVKDYFQFVSAPDHTVRYCPEL